MNDIKNFVLAGLSNIPAALAAIETQTLITVVSSIILPIFFFFAGKGIDVGIQMLRIRREEKRRLEEERNA